MRISIESYGCSANTNDAQIMRGLLKDHDFCDDAGTIIVNTCTVKGPTERKIIRSIREHEAKGKKIIITGCMAEAQYDLLMKQFPSASIISPDHIGSISEAMHSERIVLRGKNKTDKAIMPQQSSNSVSGIIQISRGCDSACTYCITKAAKGHIYSYPEESIIKKASTLIMEGKKELWLASQDNTAYGIDTGNVPLLHRIIKRISRLDGDFMIRNGMGNPHNLKHFSNDLVESYDNPKVYKFLHLPLQSGSDSILNDMRRMHTMEEYEMIANQFRKQFNDITLATDIIYGYPTETEDDFEKTIAAMKLFRFDIVNLSRFWPRPGTYAASIPMLPKSVVDDRGRRITSLFREISLERNRAWMGWEGSVLITGNGKSNSIIGRNYAYKTIALPEDEIMRFNNNNKAIKPGDKLVVRIIGYGTFHLKATILGGSNE
jgi:threonylcarbamoyladenosine tRNA methylthiotransferase CDKAL1